MAWKYFSKPKKSKLERDYEAERKEVEALRITVQKNAEWNKLEAEKKQLKEQLSAEQKAKMQKQLAPLKRAGASIEHGFISGVKFGYKEFTKSQRPHRRHRKKRKSYS